MSTPAARFGAARLADGCRLHFDDGRGPADLEELLGRAAPEQMHPSSDQPGPPGLVARAEACPVVAMEVLVEEDEVAPVRIVLELGGAAVHRPPAIRVAQENARQ